MVWPAASLATGCTATTSGKAVPAPNLALRPLTGSAIKQIMLDGAALSKLLNQPFQGVPAFPPVFGSGENLGNSYGSASPADCVGVGYTTQKTAYQSADVRNVASEMWRSDGSLAKVRDVGKASAVS
jgi:PknH-like extracellular domain